MEYNKPNDPKLYTLSIDISTEKGVNKIMRTEVPFVIL